MIIDQHRADMRIRYENYLQQLSQQQSRTQQLLFPEVAQFAPSEVPLLAQVLPVLTKVGFDLSELGGGSVAIAGVPAGLDGLDPVALVKGLMNDVKDMGSSIVEKQLNAALAQSLARQAAIPQGQVLDNEEMERLVNQLFACENVNYTPDGKAILAILPQHDIEQLLG
jgi:DNA mismatch repair protein MutL